MFLQLLCFLATLAVCVKVKLFTFHTQSHASFLGFPVHFEERLPILSCRKQIISRHSVTWETHK